MFVVGPFILTGIESEAVHVLTSFTLSVPFVGRTFTATYFTCVTCFFCWQCAPSSRHWRSAAQRQSRWLCRVDVFCRVTLQLSRGLQGLYRFRWQRCAASIRRNKRNPVMTRWMRQHRSAVVVGFQSTLPLKSTIFSLLIGDKGVFGGFRSSDVAIPLASLLTIIMTDRCVSAWIWEL